MQRESDHLPRRLWWVLAGLTLAWGFNWTAMKVSLSEVTPWTFRTLCLGLGSAGLVALLRARGPRAWNGRARVAALGGHRDARQRAARLAPRARRLRFLGVRHRAAEALPDGNARRPLHGVDHAARRDPDLHRRNVSR